MSGMIPLKSPVSAEQQLSDTHGEEEKSEDDKATEEAGTGVWGR
jgi:hypothetical protein